LDNIAAFLSRYLSIAVHHTSISFVIFHKSHWQPSNVSLQDRLDKAELRLTRVCQALVDPLPSPIKALFEVE